MAGKEEITKWVAIGVSAGLIGGGAGLGTSSLRGGSGTVKVQVDGPIKAELPPTQIELLKDQAALTPQVAQLSLDMRTFFIQYREDQAKAVESADKFKEAISLLAQRVGTVERDGQHAAGTIKRLEDEIRMIQRANNAPGVSVP